MLCNYCNKDKIVTKKDYNVGNLNICESCIAECTDFHNNITARCPLTEEEKIYGRSWSAIFASDDGAPLILLIVNRYKV